MSRERSLRGRDRGGRLRRARHAGVTRPLLALIAALVGALVLSACGATKLRTINRSAIVNPKAEALDAGASGCGSERAAVKHLTDGFTLPASAEVKTPEQLVNMAAPAVTSSSPRLPEETHLIELRNVHVIAVKQEPDSDLHVIVATSTGAELNVESPMAHCDSASPYASKLATARAALDAAMPNVSSSGYTPVNLTATIRGVLFFDVLHGQRGAPNGVELHPITYFSTGSGPAPPPPPPGPPAPPPPPAKDDALDELPGCATYPGRIFYHHLKQNHCERGFFTTP